MENTGGRRSSELYFFKILHGHFEERLRIPTTFIKNFSKELQSCKRAILEGPSGCSWHVKLNNTTNGTYFEDGWETFLSDHCLNLHDFLLFAYDGNESFVVRIFDTSACQRLDAFTVKASQESTVSTFCEERKRRGRPPKGLKKPRDDTTNKNYLDPSHLPKHLLHLEMNCKSEPQGKLRSSLKLQRPKVASKTDVQEAVFTFKALMMHSNVNHPFNLTMPVCFARPHLPSESTSLLLKNEDGKTWSVKLYVRPNQHCCLSAGWRVFVRSNHLKVGDDCEFELVDKEKLVMNVHIFRC